VVAAVCWFVIAGVLLVASQPIAGWLAEGVAPEPVRTYLLWWVLLTVPLTVIVALLMTTVVSAGATKLALVQSGLHVTVTLVASPLLLDGGLGYRAPAVAVALASLVNIVVLSTWLKRNARERLHSDSVDRKVVLDRKVWWGIVDVGVPAQLSRVATRIVNVSIVLYVADGGVAVLAGFGIAMAFLEIGGGAAGGFARAVAITMGQDLGAKAPLRARQTLRIALGLVFLVPIVAVLIQIVATRPLVAAYASDPAAIEDGVRAVRTMAWVLFPAALWQVMLGAFSAARATKRVLVVTLVAQALPLVLLSVWTGDRVVGALLVMGSMYGLCFVFYVALAVPVLWRGALAEPR
jgi:Na+-driven multidrug efflux pump